MKDRVEALAQRVGQEIKTVRGEIPSLLVLGPTDPVPGGTPAGTIILRTE